MVIGGNYLTNLDISGNNELTELSCDTNEFSVSSLNNLSEMLPVVKEGKLNFEGNPGTDACDVCIAENKGWKTPKKMTMTVEGAVEVMIRMAGNKLIYIDWGDKTDVEINKLSGEISEHSHTYTEDTVHRITIFGENITFLACEKQGITSLDVSKNATLKELNCAWNKLVINKPSTVTKLTVTGRLTGDFFKFIRNNMAVSLRVLDMRGASIEYGIIPAGAFDGCTNLTSISIPYSVTIIGEWAFANCTGLTSFTIPDSVTEICDYAFKGCTGLKSIVIPNSVKTIGNGAFCRCKEGLTSVLISELVTYIGPGAFACTGLTSVTIPALVTEIGDFAFDDCKVCITVHPDNPVYKSENGKLKYKDWSCGEWTGDPDEKYETSSEPPF